MPTYDAIYDELRASLPASVSNAEVAYAARRLAAMSAEEAEDMRQLSLAGMLGRARGSAGSGFRA